MVFLLVNHCRHNSFHNNLASVRIEPNTHWWIKLKLWPVANQAVCTGRFIYIISHFKMPQHIAETDLTFDFPPKSDLNLKIGASNTICTISHAYMLPVIQLYGSSTFSFRVAANHFIFARNYISLKFASKFTREFIILAKVCSNIIIREFCFNLPISVCLVSVHGGFYYVIINMYSFCCFLVVSLQTKRGTTQANKHFISHQSRSGQ